MKNLVIIFSLFIGLSAYGQDPDVYMRSNQTYGDYTGDDGDTCIYGTTWNCLFYVGLSEKSRYTLSFYAEGDTVTGCSGNITIQAQGSYEGSTDFDNIGSSVTWTTTADYGANTVLNTYTTLASGTLTNAQHTETTGAFNITTTDSLLYDDTLHVAAQTNTVAAQAYTDARTVTITLPGVDYRYVRILFTAASGGNVEIDKVAIKVTPILMPL